ncbi:MAG: hypothetical protein PHR25_00580 [Clostridia bacterium]|nr:hypothetical protein [Clostridia bacterium]MDD4375265.1 hypothetical protein [Clostridia bacterium]
MKKLVTSIILIVIIFLVGYYITREDTIEKILIEQVNVDDIETNNMKIKNSKYFYEKLNERQKQYYTKIAKGISNLEKTILIDVTKEKEYEKYKSDIAIAIECFLADHPEVFYVEEQYEIGMIDLLVSKVINLKPKYMMNTKRRLKILELEMEKNLNEIVTLVGGATGEYDKELKSHDILAANVSYFNAGELEKIPNIKHTSYGALVEESAVCDGITKAYQIILDKLGIESVFVTGITEGIAHAWCKVKIDGEYYNVDVTSAKALSKDSGDNSLIIHSYFNITDKEILKTHTIDHKEKLPECNSIKYNYYNYNNYTIDHFENFDYKLRQIVAKQSRNKVLEIRSIGVSNVPKNLVESLYNMNFNNYKTNNQKRLSYSKIKDDYFVIK